MRIVTVTNKCVVVQEAMDFLFRTMKHDGKVYFVGMVVFFNVSTKNGASYPAMIFKIEDPEEKEAERALVSIATGNYRIPPSEKPTFKSYFTHFVNQSYGEYFVKDDYILSKVF